MPKRILLADDSITIQKVVELTFSDGDYDVVAVNNGAKAIQKLSEMRPDIILSDIIMPEKNGYEVCEYVKSHPDLRTIPVVLLTGTFEPFDPERADKAGCDAVVTKPFESQSLIQKVEELIQRSRPQPSEESSSSASENVPEAQPPFGSEAGSAVQDPFAPEQQPARFADAPPPPQMQETPFEQAPAEAFSGETRAFPRMSFEDMERMAGEVSSPPPPVSPPPSAPESTPWDQSPSYGSEMGAGTVPMPFDDMHGAAGELLGNEAAPGLPPAASDVPFDTPAAEAFSGETRALPRMSFEEMQRMAEPSAPVTPPWNEPQPVFGGDRGVAATADQESQPMESQDVSTPEAVPSREWEPAGGPAFGDAELTAQPSSESGMWQEPQRPAEPLWMTEETPETSPGPSPFADKAEREPSPFSAEPAAMELQRGEPAWSPAPASPEPSPAAGSSDLSDEQIERIARRVVQMLSDQVVRNIAWEVIPDLAEMVVKERIRQLESEA